MSPVQHQPGERRGIFTLLRCAGAKLGWHVRCECGRETTKHLHNMPAAKSCGRECPLYVPHETRVPEARRVERHVGSRFGRLVVTEIMQRDGCTVHVRAQCDCGASHVAILGNIVAGLTRSCGCLAVESARTRFTTHGRSGTPEHHIWNGMRRRCGDPTNAAWRNYGGRGITVCERWASFENFLADMGARPSTAHSIDRIDNDGNYEPGNCRWATAREQMRNTSRTVFMVFEGVRVPAISVYEKHGVSRQLFEQRVSWGWDPVRAATQPPAGPATKAAIALRKAAA